MNLTVFNTLVLLLVAFEVFRLRMVQEGRNRPSFLAVCAVLGLLVGAAILSVAAKHC